MPKVSVIIPTYNAESFIESALLSITSQTYSDIEILVVNDGSTDNSEKIATKASERDNRIKILNQRNAGIVAALNNAIRSSDSKYILRMDSDDISMPNRIEKQLEVMEGNSNIVVCGSNIRKFGAYSQTTHYPTSNLACKTTLHINNCFAHPSVIIRREALSSATEPYDHNYTYAEDYKLWSDISGKGEFFNIKQPLLNYRIHSKQIGSTKKEAQRSAHTKVSMENLTSLGINQFSESQIRSIIWPDECSNFKNLLETATSLGNELCKKGTPKVLTSLLIGKQLLKFLTKRKSYI